MTLKLLQLICVAEKEKHVTVKETKFNSSLILIFVFPKLTIIYVYSRQYFKLCFSEKSF